MLSHYSAIVMISAFSMLGTAIGIRGNNFMDHQRKQWFQILFSLLILVNLAEWGAAFLDGNTARIGLRIALKFTELTLTPCVAFAVLMTAGKTHYRTPGLCICAANLGLQILSLFTGCVFSIDSSCVYQRNSLYSLYTAMFLGIVLLWLLASAGYIKQFQIKNRLMLVILILIEALSLISQLVLSYLRLDWCFASFGALLYYIYLDMLEQQTDPLTQLLNRRIYDVHISRLSTGSTIIFLDIDSFKAVNDTYGHNAGDACLKAASQEIKKVFADLGYCYRYGGDEFCVILSVPSDVLKKRLSDFMDNVSKTRFQGSLPLPRVSYGYATLHDGEHYEQVLDRADEMMYSYKKKHKLK